MDGSVRKGTPLASRVARGVSGPSSSCVWNARVFADDPVLCFFFGAIKLPATSSFPCPRLPLSLRPGRPTALWEKGCPPPAGGRGAECSLWTSPSQSPGFSSQGSSRSSPGTQDTRVPGSLVRPTLPQTLASFPGWSLLFLQPQPLLRAKPPALTPFCSSRSPDSAHPCHPEAPLRTHLILCPRLPMVHF